MEDRFRFRRWDKSKAKFMPVICIHPLLLQMIEERYVIMQCTGLKDKNGKLIFEGDIVQNEFSKYIYKVIWGSYGKFLLERISEEPYCIEFENDEIYEVIGNIYENPELLESEE